MKRDACFTNRRAKVSKWSHSWAQQCFIRTKNCFDKNEPCLEFRLVTDGKVLAYMGTSPI